MKSGEHFKLIWETYRANLLQFIRKRVSNDAMAEDILQTVSLKVFENLDAIRDQRKLKNWLYQITRNSIVDYYRSREIAAELPADLTQPEADNIEQTRIELERCLMPMIDSLPENYRRAIQSTDINGLTQQQLADLEGISLSGAKSRVQRGREMLRERFEQCCQFEFDNRGSPTDFSPNRSSCKSC